MFPEWTTIVGFWLGAVIGSFLNVVIYRLPRAISLSNPAHSFCPSCGHRLEARALVPLLSWAFARGKCVYCGARVPARYFWVELVNGGIWAAIWYLYFVQTPAAGPWPLGCAYALACAALVAIIWIDWELYIIPDEINAFLLVVGLGYGAISGTLVTALWGAFAGWALLFGIAFLGRVAFGKDAMGHGDIKMMRGVGAILGAKLVVANLMIAVVLGLVVSLAMLAAAGRKPKTEDTAAETAAEGEEDDWQPEPIRELLVLGISYLLCFDIVAIWWKGLYPRLGFTPEPENIEEDDWTPSATTIPFGPYLAAGAL
ncbi:prepilin peptidase, partial [bacterium]